MDTPVDKDLPPTSDAARLAAIEQTIREIWQKTLRVDQIRSADNFFELGGDSMMLMAVLARIRSELGVDIDIGAIFRSPTLHHLSEIVATRSVRGAGETGADVRSAAATPAASLSA